MRFLFLILLLSQAAQARLSRLAREQLVPEVQGLSYEEARSVLRQHEQAIRAQVKETDTPPFKTGFTQYTLHDRKTPFVFVLIPGLYRNPAQFSQIKALIAPYQQNAIYLNLPGHGRDMYAARRVNFRDWTRALGRATATALQLGDKIIFVGQSTGGALSIVHTLKHQADVAGLFLIEPALKVRFLKGRFACWAHPIVPSLNWIYNTFGNRDDDPKLLPYMATKMGCEVDKIVSTYLKANSRKRTRRQREQDLFPQLRVPVLIFNNLADTIVSTKHIQRFERLVSGPRYSVEIPREGASHHADSEFMFGVIQSHEQKFLSFMADLGLAL